jgi:Ca2+-binding RTX toxin-like protein
MPLVATGLLTATLLTVTAPSYAAGETCQEQAATVVGAPYQSPLTGTEGADVIVTNGASSVKALGGNDLICVTGGLGATVDTLLDAGAGDDVVDASGSAGGVMVSLGAGRDTYTGTRFRESVYGGIRDFLSGAWEDTETDMITTVAGSEGGSDSVSSGSDQAVPNSDVVVLGGTGSVGWWGPMAAGGRLDGGPSAGSTLGFVTGSGSVVVDNAAGSLTEDGRTVLTWTGFDGFNVGGTRAPTPSALTFAGTDRDEELSFRFPDAHTTRQRIDMGGGDDTLWLGYDDNIGARGSRYLGGPGKDHVAFWAGKHLDLDLEQERIKTKRGGSTFRSTFADFETQLVGAKNLVLKGTDKADELRFYACKATVHGRGGADDMRQSRGDDYFEAGLRCNPRKFRFFGGGGKDTMQGSTDSDVLIGGPGRDTINGNGGRDTCSGEKLRSCEIRRR